MNYKVNKRKSRIKRFLENLKSKFLPKKESEGKYKVSKRSFHQLMEDEPRLFDVARTFMLGYSQKWDGQSHKDEALREVLNYVGLPLSFPKKRGRKILKRDFKNELRNINRDSLELEIVRVANILEKYKDKVKKEKKKRKK